MKFFNLFIQPYTREKNKACIFREILLFHRMLDSLSSPTSRFCRPIYSEIDIKYDAISPDIRYTIHFSTGNEYKTDLMSHMDIIRLQVLLKYLILQSVSPTEKNVYLFD